MSQITPQEAEKEIQRLAPVLQGVRDEIERTIIGQASMIDHLLIALISGGHVLLEGVPGLAKTTAVKALASALELQFRRIQFTPDLLPSDLIGTEIFDPRSGEFSVRKGPIFAQIVLADEINRAPAKVQSALLEVMEERQVTLAGKTEKLPAPFMVLATQNPLEQEGTYALPEAQVDRFLLKVRLVYPTRDEELLILRRVQHGMPKTNAVATADQLRELGELAKSLYVDPRVEEFIVRLVDATRFPASYNAPDLVNAIAFGASPRATLGLSIAARAKAVMSGRSYVTPQDVKDVALAVLGHRILLSYEAEADGMKAEDVVARLLHTVAVP